MERITPLLPKGHRQLGRTTGKGWSTKYNLLRKGNTNKTTEGNKGERHEESGPMTNGKRVVGHPGKVAERVRGELGVDEDREVVGHE